MWGKFVDWMFSKIKRKTGITFWDRVDQARLMLSRLNDEDIASLEATRALNQIPKTSFEAISLLYRAYTAITIKAGFLEYRGCEMCQSWIEKLDNVSRHLDVHIYPAVSGDIEKFYDEILSATQEIGRSPEVIHPSGAI